MTSKATVIVLMSLSLAAGLSLAMAYQSRTSERDAIISNIEAAIGQRVKDGTYRCCIDPPCDMCFLGEWLWDDGSCRCDDEIAKGNFDRVCPECKKNLEKGECSSQVEDVCEVK